MSGEEIQKLRDAIENLHVELLQVIAALEARVKHLEGGPRYAQEPEPALWG